MKKSLNINATRNGKKVSTSIGYVNPDVANSIAGGFAQMVNALTTNTFVNAEVVKKMDTTEEEQQSGGGTGKQEGIITYNYPTVTYNGDGTLYKVQTGSVATIQSGATVPRGSVSEDIFLFATATDNYTAAVTISKGAVAPTPD